MRLRLGLLLPAVAAALCDRGVEATAPLPPPPPLPLTAWLSSSEGGTPVSTLGLLPTTGGGRRLGLGDANQGCTQTTIPNPPLNAIPNAVEWDTTQCGGWFDSVDGNRYQPCYLQCEDGSFADASTEYSFSSFWCLRQDASGMEACTAPSIPGQPYSCGSCTGNSSALGCTMNEGSTCTPNNEFCSPTDNALGSSSPARDSFADPPQASYNAYLRCNPCMLPTTPRNLNINESGVVVTLGAVSGLPVQVSYPCAAGYWGTAALTCSNLCTSVNTTTSPLSSPCSASGGGDWVGSLPVCQPCTVPALLPLGVGIAEVLGSPPYQINFSCVEGGAPPVISTCAGDTGAWEPPMPVCTSSSPSATALPSSTPSASGSQRPDNPSSSLSASAPPTDSLTPSLMPTLTGSPSRSVTPSPSDSPSLTASASVTGSQTESPSAPAPSAPALSPSPTESPTPSVSASSLPGANSPSPTASVNLIGATPPPTSPDSPTASPSHSAPRPSPAATPSTSPTGTPPPSHSPSLTAGPTPSSPPTASATSSYSPTVPPTGSGTPSGTPSRTSTPSAPRTSAASPLPSAAPMPYAELRVGVSLTAVAANASSLFQLFLANASFAQMARGALGGVIGVPARFITLQLLVDAATESLEELGSDSSQNAWSIFSGNCTRGLGPNGTEGGTGERGQGGGSASGSASPRPGAAGGTPTAVGDAVLPLTLPAYPLPSAWTADWIPGQGQGSASPAPQMRALLRRQGSGGGESTGLHSGRLLAPALSTLLLGFSVWLTPAAISDPAGCGAPVIADQQARAATAAAALNGALTVGAQPPLFGDLGTALAGAPQEAGVPGAGTLSLAMLPSPSPGLLLPGPRASCGSAGQSAGGALSAPARDGIIGGAVALAAGLCVALLALRRSRRGAAPGLASSGGKVGSTGPGRRLARLPGPAGGTVGGGSGRPESPGPGSSRWSPGQDQASHLGPRSRVYTSGPLAGSAQGQPAAAAAGGAGGVAPQVMSISALMMRRDRGTPLLQSTTPAPPQQQEAGGGGGVPLSQLLRRGQVPSQSLVGARQQGAAGLGTGGGGVNSMRLPVGSMQPQLQTLLPALGVQQQSQQTHTSRGRAASAAPAAHSLQGSSGGPGPTLNPVTAAQQQLLLRRRQTAATPDGASGAASSGGGGREASTRQQFLPTSAAAAHASGAAALQQALALSAPGLQPPRSRRSSSNASTGEGSVGERQRTRSSEAKAAQEAAPAAVVAAVTSRSGRSSSVSVAPPGILVHGGDPSTQQLQQQRGSGGGKLAGAAAAGGMVRSSTNTSLSRLPLDGTGPSPSAAVASVVAGGGAVTRQRGQSSVGASRATGGGGGKRQIVAVPLGIGAAAAQGDDPSGAPRQSRVDSNGSQSKQGASGAPRQSRVDSNGSQARQEAFGAPRQGRVDSNGSQARQEASGAPRQGRVDSNGSQARQEQRATQRGPPQLYAEASQELATLLLQQRMGRSTSVVSAGSPAGTYLLPEEDHSPAGDLGGGGAAFMLGTPPDLFGTAADETPAAARSAGLLRMHRARSDMAYSDTGSRGSFDLAQLHADAAAAALAYASAAGAAGGDTGGSPDSPEGATLLGLFAAAAMRQQAAAAASDRTLQSTSPATAASASPVVTRSGGASTLIPARRALSKPIQQLSPAPLAPETPTSAQSGGRAAAVGGGRKASGEDAATPPGGGGGIKRSRSLGASSVQARQEAAALSPLTPDDGEGLLGGRSSPSLRAPSTGHPAAAAAGASSSSSRRGRGGRGGPSGLQVTGSWERTPVGRAAAIQAQALDAAALAAATVAERGGGELGREDSLMDKIMSEALGVLNVARPVGAAAAPRHINIPVLVQRPDSPGALQQASRARRPGAAANGGSVGAAGPASGTGRASPSPGSLRPTAGGASPSPAAKQPHRGDARATSSWWGSLVGSSR